MEVSQELIDSLLEEHDALMERLCQMDPIDPKYIRVQKAVAENWETIQKIQDNFEEKKSKRIEWGIKIGLAALGVAGTVLEIYLRTKGTKSVLDRIYAYETEAILPQNKVNLAQRILTDKAKV